VSLMSFMLLIISLFVGFALVAAASNPSTASGIIDGATLTGLFVGAMLLFVWAPIFLTSVALAIKAIRQGDQWGYACLLAHVMIIGGFCALSLIAKTFDTPERRAAQQQKWLQRRSSRQAPRPLGGIDIARDSVLYKVSTSPWLISGSVAVLALGLALRVICSPSFNDPRTPVSISTQSRTESDASALDAKCPVCQANIGRVLLSGGRVCPACNTAFLQESSPESERKGPGNIGAVFVEGSSVQRITAAVLAGGLLFFSAAWLWYWALGDSATSTRMLIMAGLLAGGLGGMFLARVSKDRTA
jgi:hypothetical protein